ncbi:DUF4175 family protein [Planktosalinus lacus]|uniref:ATPase n=1 Tax=Planktosalinus lacus TaxID=1526573 RepID=A0A8J2V778_9FLAO|nr:DUF4175 family protein [Planktosalinus lacus]GGD80260.1 ATPase [Planktosalinus lacus]
MSNFDHIIQKLEQFIKKYYTNELIKGCILFVAIGLLYFLFTLLIEHFLWLSQTGRTILFWTFIAVELALFLRFIAFPLSKLLKIQDGLELSQASKIIGAHFPEVNDKLLNVLQLKKNAKQSELLLASIEQKSVELHPIPFAKAINFKQNIKYVKYIAIPVVVYLLFVITGNSGIFSGSYERVVNYKTAYEPPAPFSFFVINDNLEALENKPFELHVRTTGEVTPETASISFNDEEYFLQKTAPGEFKYTFSQPIENISFRLRANEVTSKPYILDVIKVPSLLSFEMSLEYPNYTGKSDETLKSTGNATIPEGTRVTWNLKTKQTDKVRLKTSDTAYLFEKNLPDFHISKNIYSPVKYTISTSNEKLKDFENLGFSLRVIKDQYPEINLEAKQDSLDSRVTYFMGRVSDDYGLSKLQIVYYQDDKPEEKHQKSITLNKGTFDQFLYVFPGELPLEEGRVYSYYFEVFDNDAINSPKSSKSTPFSFRKLTKDELENHQLKEQKETIQGLDKTLQNLDKQNKDLEELSKLQKQKKELNWNDKQKFEEFLKRQKLQEEMMKKFSEKTKENLEDFQKENKENDPKKEELQERFEENEERLEENEKLLEELEKLKEKIADEELFEKMEELSKQNKKQQRNLEQLLELTKRYYVEKKAQKLAEELEKLAKEQETLSDEDIENNTKENQEEINKKFDEFKKEMKELKEENEDLKSPMELPDNETKEQEVQEEQKQATEKLEQDQQEGAKQNQKNAAQKMREMSEQMQMQMASGSSESQQEDIEMLRQILDNLVIYSLSQEDLMEDFKNTGYGNPLFGKKLVRQNELKQNFQHVDDSLFSLALRNPMVGTTINDLIEDVHYNINKSIEELADNKIRNGIASQQYSITGANDLAVLLGDALNTMQMQMQMQMGAPGQGEGEQGQGFQLPDIIKMQESLNEQMEQGANPGKGEQGAQEGEGEGKGQGEGSSGSDGEGKNGEGSNKKEGNEGKESGEGDLQSEELSGQLFEIYKQQQMLRNQLENKLREEGLPTDASQLIKQMEQVEQDLLERGFNNETLRKMNNIKHQLLKLEKAAFQQGEDEKRQGRTNEFEYESTVNKQLENARKYFNNVEILNRQQLPLRQIYQQKVQDYFKTDND